MIDVVRRMPFTRQLWAGIVVAVVLLLAALLGRRASSSSLVLLIALAGGAVLLQHPVLGLFALPVAALLVRLEFGTGTEVALNLATMLVPALGAIWILDMVRRHDLRLVPSRANRPFLLFLLAGLFSLLVGVVLWDPAVPRSGNLILVQLAQWAIFAFAAVAFWLMGNLVRDEAFLRRLTFFYLAIAGGLAIWRVLPGGTGLGYTIATFALERSPFWLLLAALGSGQLLFNPKLSAGWRLFLLAALVAVLFYAFVLERVTLSHLVGVASAIGTLVWLRWPRLRWAFVGIVVLSALLFSPALYKFAGGDAEWEESGGSREALIGRVIEVSMRNPITGLGPAAYRAYARMQPLTYDRAYYIEPQVNSHNNYVDLFSQVGLLGLGLFFWLAIELVGLGVRVRTHFTEGFAAGYVNAMLGAWVGSLAVMLFADWILPFVYNIGFPGFQASVLVWMFLGGLVALEQIARQSSREVDSSHGFKN